MAKLFIYSKQKAMKKGNKKFRTYWTEMNLVVKGEEEKGKQLKSVTVKFRQDAGDTSKVIRGVLDAEVNAPKVWEITKDDNGENLYPVVWIRKINKYEYVPYEEENDFVGVEQDTPKTTIVENKESSTENDLPF